LIFLKYCKVLQHFALKTVKVTQNDLLKPKKVIKNQLLANFCFSAEPFQTPAAALVKLELTKFLKFFKFCHKFALKTI